MTNPFTAFVFDATGEAQTPNTRTLPDRLAEVKNVKDFGAVGDWNGTSGTDNWAAIMSAFNWGQITLVVNGTPSGNVVPFASVPASILANQMYATDITTPSAIPQEGGKITGVSSTTLTLENAGAIASGDTITVNWIVKGTIYFPPGNYFVSKPLRFCANEDGNITGTYIGDFGVSIITGNFADYVFIQDTEAVSNGTVFDKLTIVNTNATGGGIRLGGTVCGAIRNCKVTANRGITTFGADAFTSGQYFGSLEISIENCSVDPGSNVANSQGIMLLSDGPIINCRVTNYATGLLTAGGEGAQTILGCYFEKCTNAVLLGFGPDGRNDTASAVVIAGCWFKNNSVALNFPHSVSLCTFIGLCIEGANGQAPSGANCQYGILDGGGSAAIGNSLFAGITVTGQYNVAGIYFPGDSQLQNNTVMGAHSVSWSISPQAGQHSDGTEFIACDVASVYTVGQLLSGGLPEGTCFNVSDNTGTTWGGTAAGSGSTHAKVRLNASNYTVVGI